MDADDVGYDCAFVRNPPEEIQTDCPICLLVLRRPSQLECCGNLFCGSCLNKALRDGNNSCPMCKRRYPTVFIDKHHMRKLSGFKVYCIMHRAKDGAGEGSGCQWVGELGQLDEHCNATPTPQNQLKGCLFVEISCNLCGEIMKRSILENHLINCPQREYKCPHCDYLSTYVDVTENHVQVCPCHPVNCPHCEVQFMRREVTKHVKNDCKLTPITCAFILVGCIEIVPRVEMSAHMKKCGLIHAERLIDQTAGCENNELMHYIPLLRSSIQELYDENMTHREKEATAVKKKSLMESLELFLVLAVGVLFLISPQLVIVLVVVVLLLVKFGSNNFNFQNWRQFN